MDGRERAGNSLGRALLGESGASEATGWTDRKAWEIACGELFWKGATLQRRQGGRTGKSGK